MRMRSGRELLCAVLALAGVVCFATSARADTVCTGSLANSTIRGNVIVPSGASCTLTNVLVTGDVQVQAGAGSLTAISTYISGDVKSQGAAITLMLGGDGNYFATDITTIGGHLQATGGSLFVEGVFIRGDVQAQGMDSVAMGGNWIGGTLAIQGTTSVSPQFGTNLVCATTVGNSFQLQNSRLGATFALGTDLVPGCFGNTIIGDAAINNNAAAVTVKGDIVIGNLQCKGNSISAPPTGSGNAVGGVKSGQCAGL